MARGATDGWIVRPRPNPGAALRLFCFPYAGAGAPIFRDWPAGLPETVEVCAVQLPGRGSRVRETPFTEVAPLLSALSDSLERDLEGPFALFGHSLGALLAFELARELRREFLPQPVRLFVSGCGAPQEPYLYPPIHTLPEAKFLAELQRWGGTPLEVLAHQELMQLLLPALRADFALRETYAYADEPPLDCPISAFGGLDDRWVSRESLDAWRAQTYAAFSLQLLPGDHFFLASSRPRLLAAIAETLAAHLAAAG